MAETTSPPGWLLELANRVTRLLSGPAPLPPIGCHYYFSCQQDHWEVTLFASTTEVVGGEWDGRLLPAPFRIDLAALRNLFSEIDVFGWQAHTAGSEDELGSHISLEGKYRGRRVWLRITAEAPTCFEPGRIAHVYSAQWENVW